jgi:hypothetical protein
LGHAKGVQNMMNNPKAMHLKDELNRKKNCPFIDKYVTRMYGSRHITSWAVMNKNKTIFDLVTISDMANMVAVIKNGHGFWEQLHENQFLASGEEGGQRWEREQEESLTKKIPKIAKKAGKKRQCNTSG